MPKLAINKKATFDYDLQEKFEGGLKLTGAEVKSAKAGHIQLKGAFLFVHGNELWLKNSFIAAYKPAGDAGAYDPYRDRKVLVHTKEIKRFTGKTQSEGLTLVPICVYTSRNLIKLEFALARGKKKYEKRETIKKRDVKRQLEQRMKG
ncbi:MAG: SsrA-binding protein SmpB [Patescibacteria group bacterium]